MKREKRREQKSRRESQRWGGEWVDSEEWQERPEGDPHQPYPSSASRSGLRGQREDCWQERLLLWFVCLMSFSSLFVVVSPLLLLTFPPVYLILFPPSHPPSGSSGTSQFSLCRLSRWPSLRSALECCFYIAASGGMWSLFWTARQTDGGFHAAFMRLSETFPWKRHFPVSLRPQLSHFSLSCLFLFFLSLSLLLSPFFLACLRLGQGQPAAESEVESRQVCVTNNYFPRQASEHRASPRVQSKAANRSCESDTAGKGSEFLFLLCSMNLFDSDSGRLVPRAPSPPLPSVF